MSCFINTRYFQNRDEIARLGGRPKGGSRLARFWKPQVIGLPLRHVVRPVAKHEQLSQADVIIAATARKQYIHKNVGMQQHRLDNSVRDRMWKLVAIARCEM